MDRSLNQSSRGRGQFKASAVNLGSSHWSGETPCRPPPGLACHCCRNALGWAMIPRRVASLSLSLSQLSLQKPGPTIKQAVLTRSPASCQRENYSFRGQISYEERQSDKAEIKSRASPLVAGVSRAELVSAGPWGGQARSAPICFIQSRYLPAVHRARAHSQDWDSSEERQGHVTAGWRHAHEVTARCDGRAGRMLTRSVTK